MQLVGNLFWFRVGTILRYCLMPRRIPMQRSSILDELFTWNGMCFVGADRGRWRSGSLIDGDYFQELVTDIPHEMSTKHTLWLSSGTVGNRRGLRDKGNQSHLASLVSWIFFKPHTFHRPSRTWPWFDCFCKDNLFTLWINGWYTLF